MPWYHLKIWSKVEERYIEPGNDHFVRSMREDPDRHVFVGESECQLEVLIPEIATDEGPWVLAGSRPRKCPICADRRASSSASARTATRRRSGTGSSTRRSARAARATPARTTRRAASDR